MTTIPVSALSPQVHAAPIQSSFTTLKRLQSRDPIIEDDLSLGEEHTRERSYSPLLNPIPATLAADAAFEHSDVVMPTASLDDGKCTQNEEDIGDDDIARAVRRHIAEASAQTERFPRSTQILRVPPSGFFYALPKDVDAGGDDTNSDLTAEDDHLATCPGTHDDADSLTVDTDDDKGDGVGLVRAVLSVFNPGGSTGSVGVSAGMRSSAHARPPIPHPGAYPVVRPTPQPASVGSSSASTARSAETGHSSACTHRAAGGWGWFEDVHAPHTPFKAMGSDGGSAATGSSPQDTLHRGIISHVLNSGGTDAGESAVIDRLRKGALGRGEAAPLSAEKISPDVAAVTAPTYVLEESISSQVLWKFTAGNRPPQPMEERAFFERMWKDNFEQSEVKYGLPKEVLTAASPLDLSPFEDSIWGIPADDHLSLSDFHAMNSRIGAATKRSRGRPEPDHLDMELDIMHEKARGMLGASQRGSVSQANSTSGRRRGASKEKQSERIRVILKGENIYGTTVSKSFLRGGRSVGIGAVETISISIASFRVVESNGRKFAQFLVVFCPGDFRDTIGVWKRYSDFERLSRKLQAVEDSCRTMVSGIVPFLPEEQETGEALPNALTSWKLLKKRQRWFRCLDAGYLSLKVFLLERFLHDILFEGNSPHILRDFVGVDVESVHAQ
eukprot:CAMPEP_0194277716 /NCGR_PEP_ID=MMETSP0169-20130528/9961_1 /TAXON_ID=218684 /ORGANISM="Corethron pennatum, Strain L29A3" /LENGTH=670 /DNA_ID=CAMNT_0039021747 /DNA_START=132 /DNA_END=2144 /DNA_ORIENTATION=+